MTLLTLFQSQGGGPNPSITANTFGDSTRSSRPYSRPHIDETIDEIDHDTIARDDDDIAAIMVMIVSKL